MHAYNMHSAHKYMQELKAQCSSASFRLYCVFNSRCTYTYVSKEVVLHNRCIFGVECDGTKVVIWRACCRSVSHADARTDTLNERQAEPAVLKQVLEAQRNL